MLAKQYTTEVLALTQRVIDSQAEQIERAADLIFSSLRKDALLHVFGCGHSHILSEECFYRAGGLVPINPIFETSTMLHEGAVKSSQIERMSGYAELILANYEVHAGECLLIFSTSGINALPIEMAISAKKKGLSVVALTSCCYLNHPSRYPTGEHLADIADLVIDTQIPCGDALLHLSSTVSAVPGSTVVGCTLLNALIAEILERYRQNGMTPPVFTSGNTEGGYEKNLEYIAAYRNRVRAL